MNTKKVPVLLALILIYSPYVIAEYDDKSKLNDREILQVVVTANLVDIENGELNKKKASNKQVHAFANPMIKERVDLSKKAQVLVTKLKKPTEESSISKDMNVEGQKNLDQLNNLNGKEFDKAYIDAEIKQNQELIDVAYNTLHAVKDEDTRALLTKAHPALAAHSELAKRIQVSLTNTP